MSWFPYDDASRKILGLAREEALRHGHDYIGTAHVLLGLLDAGPCPASVVLERLEVDPADLRRHVLALLEPGRAVEPPGQLPYTSLMKDAFDALAAAAEEQGLHELDTAHLLWCLAVPERSRAAAALGECGIAAPALHGQVFHR